VDGCKERRGKPTVEDADLQETLSPHGMWIEYEVAFTGSRQGVAASCEKTD
jgi:hypothetical protein